MNHHNSPKVTVVFDIPPMSAGELAKRRELFERVSLPTLILRLAAAVGQPQVLRKSVESSMREIVPVLSVAHGDEQSGAEA